MAEECTQLTIVIPALNEAQRIRPTLEEYAGHFQALYGQRFEILVVLNGCTDDTRSVVEEETERFRQIRFIEFVQPLGKGGALWEGFQASKGEILAFADADNMVKASETEKLIQSLDNYDIATGNRFSGDQENRGQPFGRWLASRSLNTWVRLFLRVQLQDTQCGAKALRSSAWELLAPLIKEKGWAFDLDLLSTANRLGLKVVDIPVEWEHIEEGSKLRPLTDGPKAIIATFRIKFRNR